MIRPSRPSFLLGLFLAAAPALALGGAFGATGGSFLGGTLTSGLTFSGVTTDITAASGEDVTIAGGATSGSVVVRSIDNATDIQDSASNVEGQVVTSSSAAVISLVQGTGSSAGALMLIAGRGFLGSTGAVAANAVAVSLGEGFNTSAGTGTSHVQVYGGGALQFNTVQSVTIADNGAGTAPTDTTSPTSSWVDVTCNDVHGCNYNPGETSVIQGWLIEVCNNSASNAVTINDSAGVVNVRGAASLALASGECSQCFYSQLNQWNCL